MKTKFSIEQAYEIFAARIVRVCTGRGARVASDGAQVLNTPVGGLRVDIQGNFIMCEFASKSGGFWATKGGTDAGTGMWCHRCPREIEDLTGDYYVDRFAAVLGVVFAFAPTAEQLRKIMLEQREQHRHVEKMAAFFAMLPDMDEPESAKPPVGKDVRMPTTDVKPARKAAKLKARKAAKPKAKDAGRKRRGKVSAR